MNFKCIYFDDDKAMLAFLDEHWDRVLNVSYDDTNSMLPWHWMVRVMPSVETKPQLKDSLGDRS